MKKGIKYAAFALVAVFAISVAYAQAPLKKPTAPVKKEQTSKKSKGANKNKDKTSSAKPSPADGTVNGYGYVDLGLPSGLKWATCNVGASSPEESGGYYAWGETSEKSDYSEATYQHWVDSNRDGDFDSNEGTITTDIAGTEYDVAHVKWDGSWRMPRRDEIEELVNNCTLQWTKVNGVAGQKVTGPNGKSIFLPAAGGRYGTSLSNAGYYGYYWSSAPNGSSSDGAFYLSFGSGGSYWNHYGWRGHGFSIRPVSE